MEQDVEVAMGAGVEGVVEVREIRLVSGCV